VVVDEVIEIRNAAVDVQFEAKVGPLSSANFSLVTIVSLSYLENFIHNDIVAKIIYFLTLNVCIR